MAKEEKLAAKQSKQREKEKQREELSHTKHKATPLERNHTEPQDFFSTKLNREDTDESSLFSKPSITSKDKKGSIILRIGHKLKHTEPLKHTESVDSDVRSISTTKSSSSQTSNTSKKSSRKVGLFGLRKRN